MILLIIKCIWAEGQQRTHVGLQLITGTRRQSAQNGHPDLNIENKDIISSNNQHSTQHKGIKCNNYSKTEEHNPFGPRDAVYSFYRTRGPTIKLWSELLKVVYQNELNSMHTLKFKCSARQNKENALLHHSKSSSGIISTILVTIQLVRFADLFVNCIIALDVEIQKLEKFWPTVRWKFMLANCCHQLCQRFANTLSII